jgi:hypothetical protein
MKPTAQTRRIMTLTLQLPPETEKQLHERAAQAGSSVEGLVLKLIEESLGVNGEPASQAGTSFAEILAPLHQEVAESGMTEKELDELVHESIEEVRAEKRQKTQQ